jgi:hypothetical protein
MIQLPDAGIYIRAQQSAGIIRHVLVDELRLQAPARYVMTEDPVHGLTWMLAEMDARNLGASINRYTSGAVMHQLSTALAGTPVVLSNHSGVRYAVLLERQPARAAEWSMMDAWTGGALPLGALPGGRLLTVDVERYPHFLVAGTTGSGKSRYGLRILVAGALADGWQVVIGGRRLDFAPFLDHPNAHMVDYSPREEPGRAIDMLRQVYAEMDRRERVLVESSASLWAQTGQPRTMVVMDEFSNLADALADQGRQTELWRWAALCTREARKYGVHMIYALQDPNYREIDLRIRRNTTVITFRVKDASVSRTLGLAGAERLRERQFLAALAEPVRGQAFAPTDDDVRQFLASRTTPRHPAPKWLSVEQPAEPASGENEIDRMADQVRDQWYAGMSKRQLARLLGGEYAGAFCRKVDAVMVVLGATTTINGPDLGPEAV